VNTGFDQRFAELKELVNTRLNELLDKKEPVTLYEPMRYSVASGGKRIRPVLLLLSAEAVGGKAEDALNAAAALELVHNFTLVHDDIMDNDDWRRGRETVHKKWDESVAILAGDGLLVKAYDALAAINYPQLQNIIRQFSQSILQVCEGQALDKEFETRQDVSLQEYFEMIDNKTGRLFSVSCEIGAIIGGGTAEQVHALAVYGEKLGHAFQIQDDLLDLTAEQDVLGKDIGSDFEEDKKTFLMIHAAQYASPDAKRRLQRIREKQTIDQNDIQEIIEILTQSGTIAAAQKEVSSALQEAENALSTLPESNARSYLGQLLKVLQYRNA